MSIESLLSENRAELESIDIHLNNTFITISKHSLLENEQFISNFHQPKSHTEAKDTRSINQLNHQYEELESNLQDLNRLQSTYNHYQEIKQLVDKGNQLNLLDFQQLFTLFEDSSKYYKTIEDDILIYNIVHKSIDTLYETFVEILNNYLLTLLPNEFTIENISGLQEFNKLLIKNNNIKLKNYTILRTKWDQLVEYILVNNHHLDLDDSNLDIDLVSIKLSTNENDKQFIKSVSNLITFLNYVGNDSIKHYINSKLSTLFVNKLSIQISSINNDPSHISELNQLLTVSRSSGWNVLVGFQEGHKIEDNLNKLYHDWIIDQFIDELRKVFKDEQLIKNIDNEPEPEPEQEDATGKASNSSATDDDGWNDDAWNDDGWDDDDDDDTNGNKNNNNKEDTVGKKDGVKISQLSDEIINIIKEFESQSTDTKYLISTIKSLSLVRYPPINESILIYNDLNYISKSINSDNLKRFTESIWNQNLVNIYQQLKLVLISLNLDSTLEDAGNEDDLDDYNLNQLSLIYSIFNSLYNDSDYKQLNPPKFNHLIKDIIDFLNNYLVSIILSLDDIPEYQSVKLCKVIDSINNITIPFITHEQKEEISSYHRLDNYKFLIKNHLRDIMDRFNDAEFFDLTTEELVTMIKKLFIQSTLRDDYIEEIIEIRNLT
ncbi:retrograde transport protein Dsl1 C terminal-domain-containing protein [Scheffersomyces amazonensis]|uniref:retrograde transport protein Dsl1 C terminal-domain-containing protein n=1 Tax=Scheffersomyces amazonensis TaxID=1078765 RepID=UPI00315D345D